MIGLFGSGEFEEWAEPVDRLLLDSAANSSGRVLILPTASAPEGDEVFDRWGAMGTDHYRRIGATPEVVPLKTREDAFSSEIAGRVEGAGLIFFSGGNPGYAAKVLKGTPFWKAVVRAIRSGTSFGGCSAGAGMLGAIAPDVTSDVVAGNFEATIWLEGLKLYPQLFVGAHWDALETFVPGLTDYVIRSIPPDCCLLAVDENTAVVGIGGRWTVHGRGAATVIQPGGALRSFHTNESFELSEAREVLE